MSEAATFSCGIENRPPVEAFTSAHGCVALRTRLVIIATLFAAFVGSATTLAAATPLNDETVGPAVAARARDQRGDERMRHSE